MFRIMCNYDLLKQQELLLIMMIYHGCYKPLEDFTQVLDKRYIPFAVPLSAVSKL
jgi:hypothetical protein